jgi:RNA polymerase sigma-70 factor (ECF subfamily)
MSRTPREIYDQLLVARCQRQDLAAWDELVRRWNPPLLYYLRRLIDNEHDATNVLQEVWLHAFRGMSALNDRARLAPWLYTIARRRALTHFRRDYARPEQTPEPLDDINEPAVNETLQLENTEWVHFGLSRLALPDREVLTLYFLEDLTIDEIGQLLSIPAGTVKSRLFKARRELKRLLEKECRRDA